MTKARFSHAQCPHPSTKAARAKCRAALRAAAEPVAAAALRAGKETKPATAPVVVTPAISPAREETCTKCGEAYVTTTPVVIDVDPLCYPCTPAAAVEITPDNWREHKSQPASVYVVGVAEPFAAQSITGYSIKFLQFTDLEGKRQRIPVSTVERVTV
ncbi:hypothetical protein [Streptomyces sp. NPDC002587]